MMPEDALPGDLLTQITANDRDLTDTRLIYAIISDDWLEYFDVDAKGNIYLSDNKVLDRENASQIEFVLVAHDGRGKEMSHKSPKNVFTGKNSSATVVINVADVNDNAPSFAFQSPLVWNATEGTFRVLSRHKSIHS